MSLTLTLALLKIVMGQKIIAATGVNVSYVLET